MMQTQSLSQPSLKTQLRALFVIARKDWKVFWRYPLNAVSNIFQPIIWITPVYFMGKAFSTNGQALGFAAYSGTGDYMSFILLGTVLSNFILTVFWGMGYALKEDMDAGVLESNWLTPVSRLLILIGRTLTSLLTTTITSLIMLAIAGALFGFKPTGNTLAAFSHSYSHAARSIWIWVCLRGHCPPDARSQHTRRRQQFPRYRDFQARTSL